MIVFLIAVIIIVISVLIVMSIRNGIRQGKASNHINIEIEVTNKSK